MSEEIFEKEELLENEEVAEAEVEVDEEEKGGFGLNILCFDKWSKKQTLSIFDFSSLQGVLNSVLLIGAIVLLVKNHKLRKRK